MSTIGNLVVKITSDASDFEQGTIKSRLALSALKTGAIAAVGVMTGIGIGPALALSKLGTAAKWAAGGMLALGGAAEGVSIGVGVKMAAEFEQLSVSFETMLKSGPKAAQLLEEITSFAAKTPLQFDELAGAARSLLAFGVSSDQVIPSLRVLGDVASGVGQPLGEVAEIYGKARVQGRLFAEDINQFTGRGIPVVTELAKKFGVTGEQLKKMVEDGKVGFADLQEVFIGLTKEGGQFSGMMDKQSTTMVGLSSTLKDNLALSVRDVGQAFSSAFQLSQLTAGLVGFTGEIRNLTKELSVLASYLNTGKTGQSILGNIGAGLGMLPKDALNAAQFGVGGALSRRAQDLFGRATAGGGGAGGLNVERGAATTDPANVAALSEATKRFANSQREAASIVQQSKPKLDTLYESSQKLWGSFLFGTTSAAQLQGGLNHLNAQYDKDSGALKKREEAEKKLADRMEETRKAAMSQFEAMESAGKRIFEQNQTPAEKYAASIREVTSLWAVGAIDARTFGREVKRLDEERKIALNGGDVPLVGEGLSAEQDAALKAYQDSLKGPNLNRPGALQAGSVEAFSASQRSQNALNDPMEKLVKSNQETNAIAKKNHQLISDTNSGIKQLNATLGAAEVVV